MTNPPEAAEAMKSLHEENERLKRELEIMKGALNILKRNMILAIRRASRHLKTQSNPLIGLKSVLEALPPIEDLTGTTPLCDRCNEACFKNCSKYCDVVLCQECSDIPPVLGTNQPTQNPNE